MASRKTICAECANRRLVDTAAESSADTVRVVRAGGTPFCFAPETRVDPLSGVSCLPRPCAVINVAAACAWFVEGTSAEEGDRKVRNGEGLVTPPSAAGGVIPSQLSPEQVGALKAAETAKAPPPFAFTPPAAPKKAGI